MGTWGALGETTQKVPALCADVKGVAAGAGCEVRSCREDLDCTVSPGLPAQPTQSFVVPASSTGFLSFTPLQR